MNQLQAILSGYLDRERAARELSQSPRQLHDAIQCWIFTDWLSRRKRDAVALPRQWADVKMCRDFMEWLKVRGIIP